MASSSSLSSRSRSRSRALRHSPSSPSTLSEDAARSFRPGGLSSLLETDDYGESEGEFDEISWTVADEEEYPLPNPLEKPFDFYCNLKGKHQPAGMNLLKIFNWFTNAEVLDGKLLSATHLSLAFNAFGQPALTLPQLEEMLRLLCRERLLREAVLRARLADPRALRARRRRLAASPVSSLSSASELPSSEGAQEAFEEGEEEGEGEDEGEGGGDEGDGEGEALEQVEAGAEGASPSKSTPSQLQGSVGKDRSTVKKSAKPSTTGEEAGSRRGSKSLTASARSSAKNSKTKSKG